MSEYRNWRRHCASEDVPPDTCGESPSCKTRPLLRWQHHFEQLPVALYHKSTACRCVSCSRATFRELDVKIAQKLHQLDRKDVILQNRSFLLVPLVTRLINHNLFFALWTSMDRNAATSRRKQNRPREFAKMSTAPQRERSF